MTGNSLLTENLEDINWTLLQQSSDGRGLHTLKHGPSVINDLAYYICLFSRMNVGQEGRIHVGKPHAENLSQRIKWC